MIDAPSGVHPCTTSLPGCHVNRFGSPVKAEPGRVAVRLDAGHDLADVVRALDAESLKVAHLELDEPSLDDVFLAKTGHRLEGQAEAQPEPVGA